VHAAGPIGRAKRSVALLRPGTTLRTEPRADDLALSSGTPPQGYAELEGGHDRAAQHSANT